MKNPGKTFDKSLFFKINEEQVKKLIDYYFKDEEIKGKAILDAGCRLGEYSKYFAEKGAKGVVGLDLSEKAIEFASKNNNNKNIKFISGNIMDLSGFGDASFDIVFCIGTMPYIAPKNVNKVIGEFIRVSKPNATILVLFQKKKGFAGNLARIAANSFPFGLWLGMTDVLVPLLKPVASVLLKRKISKEYLKYGIFLSLRGVHFGIPADFERRFSKFKIKTAECESYSEGTTSSYKIREQK